MKVLLLTLLHLAVMTAKPFGTGGVRAVIAENLLLKQQLSVLRGEHVDGVDRSKTTTD